MRSPAVHAFEALDSTNAEALRRMQEGRARHGDAFVATAQTAGRGRAGRRWRSLPGNLHATVVAVPPEGRNPADLAFVAGLAAMNALAEAAPGAAFALKWPNDVLCGGRKIAGVLIEAGETGYAVGVGMNLASAPDGVRTPATSLREAGVAADASDMLARLQRFFAAWHGLWAEEGFAPVRDAWLASAHRRGDLVAAATASGRVEGRFAGLDDDGALALIDASGVRRRILSGDVTAEA